MNVLLCALNALSEKAARSALSEAHPEFFRAHDASDALRLMAIAPPSIVVLGGPGQAMAETCRRIRAAERERQAVIVALNDRAEDVPALIDAGADDYFVQPPGRDQLQNRLLLAGRAASSFASGWPGQNERAQYLRLSAQLFCMAGFDGSFRSVGPEWTRLLGWSSAELLAATWLNLVHPDDRAASIATVEGLKAGAPPCTVINRCVCKDGSWRWLEWQCEGQVERGLIYAIARDVSEIMSAKETLRELSESLATTLDSIGDGVIATDLGGAVLRMNPVAEKLTGWTLAEAGNRSLREVLPIIDADTRARIDNPVQEALRDGVVVQLSRRTLLQRRDGSELPIGDSCSPIRSSGKVIGAVMVFRDLTAQQSADKARASLEKRLVFADRMASVGTLAAGVAHEMNNPLGYVSANVDTAIEEVRAIGGGSASGRMKELEQMLLEAREGLARVGKIVRGLKTFSRLEDEKPGVIDLVPVLELAINMALNEIRHRARLVKEFGALPLVEADPARLGQVFINLLVNAAQAFPSGGMDCNEIRIVTSTDAQGRAVVEIRDTGPGIPPALLGRVFDPFFTTKPNGAGTGLGLAISHNIVTGMGGEISVQSRLGEGTVFRVALPPSRAVEPSPPPRRTAHPPAGGKSARVLVVDDEPSLGQAICRVLRSHDVTVVTTAQEALDLLESGKEFDVILSDLMMPGISGMEFYKVLARVQPKLVSRVVFLTGGAFTPEANAFLDTVGNERMDKPFDPNKLREMVGRFFS